MNVRDAFRLKTWASAGGEFGARRQGPGQPRATLAGRAVGPTRPAPDGGRKGIWKEGSLGSAWTGVSLLACKPSRPPAAQTLTAAQSTEGKWGCTPGAPLGAGAAVGSQGAPATCELQDRVTPRTHTPLHPGTGGRARPASTVPLSEKQKCS